MHTTLKGSRKQVTAAAVLAAVAGVAVSSLPAQATPSTSTSEVLAHASFRPLNIFALNRTISGQPWLVFLSTLGTTDGYVVRNDFQPGQTTGWHNHSGPSLIFVVSGSVTNYSSDQPQCSGVTYPAGSTFVDQGGTDVHELVNQGTVPAETIAVQFIPNGQSRRIDEPEPANCHV